MHPFNGCRTTQKLSFVKNATLQWSNVQGGNLTTLNFYPNSRFWTRGIHGNGGAPQISITGKV